MDVFFAGLESVIGFTRSALLVVAALLAIVAVVDWAVRTRRLNPFGAIARFFRRRVDPLLVPVERQVIRFGGRPASAPWWALGAAMVLGILTLALLRFVGEEATAVYMASRGGAMGIVVLLIAWVFDLLEIALLVRVLSSLLQVSPWSRWVRWSYLLTDWLIVPLRRALPPVGMFDLSPLVAYAIIWVARMIVFRGLI